MKKIIYIMVIAAVATACHFGADESKGSLERNKEYGKTKSEGPQTPVADDEFLKSNGAKVDSTQAAKPDSTKK